jgi:hypothetical protein
MLSLDATTLLGLAAAGVAGVWLVVRQRAATIEDAIDTDPNVIKTRAHIESVRNVTAALRPVADILHSELVELSGHDADISHMRAMAASFNTGSSAGSAGQRQFDRIVLGHLAEVLRGTGRISDLKDREAQRPLRVQAEEAMWRKRADNRWIEATLTAQALADVRQGPKAQPPSDAKEMLRASLLTAIESANADGQDAGNLERALAALTSEMLP